MVYIFLQLLFAVYATVDRPVIGILALLIDGEISFPASYAKFVELGGARVVPILPTLSTSEMKSTLEKIDGALFTGGADVSQQRWTAINTIMEHVKQNKWFPLWATCLGFQDILLYEGVDLFRTKADGQTTSVQLDIQLIRESRMFGSMNSLTQLVVKLLGTDITANTHNYGVNKTALASVSNNYNVLGTSLDMEGVEYIAIVEHKYLPIFGTQFHPEKVMFEWNELYDNYLPRTYGAMVANTYFSQFFVNEVRKGAGHVSSADQKWVDENVIYNYNPIYLGRAGENVTEYEQMYIFD